MAGDPNGIWLAAWISAGLAWVGARLLLPSRRAKRKKSSPPRHWRNAAQKLGLHWDEKFARVSGWTAGRYVQAWAVHDVTYVSFALWPPLDLDLGANDPEPVGGTHRLSRVIARSRQRERVRHFFTPELREAFVSRRVLEEDEIRLELTDESLQLIQDDVAHATRLRLMINLGGAIAEAIDRAREQVPVPRQLAELDAEWDALADRRNFVRTRTPLGFRGDVAGTRIRCFTVRRRFVARAEFRAVLELGFRVTSRSAHPPRVPWSMRTTRTGDAEFDGRFDVACIDSDGLNQLLSPEIRRSLLDLTRLCSGVMVDDYGVTLEGPLDETPVEELIDAAQTLALAIDERPRRDRAYR